MHCKETVHRVPFVCTTYDGLRKDFCVSLQLLAQQALCSELIAMNTESKLKLLRCMNGAPAMDWTHVYITFLIMLTKCGFIARILLICKYMYFVPITGQHLLLRYLWHLQ